MDRTTLVELQKEGGRRLIDNLAANGVEVTAAAWLKESDGGWNLYIATPLVTRSKGMGQALGRIGDVMRQTMEPFWIGLLSFRVISSDSPVARAISDFNERYPLDKATDWGADQFGDLYTEGAYIYPRPATAVVGAK